jgi:hypothetical protein
VNLLVHQAGICRVGFRVFRGAIACIIAFSYVVMKMLHCSIHASPSETR